jgi:methylmalonyl-CoA/ethylmalonyl-CoA epimerase
MKVAMNKFHHIGIFVKDLEYGKSEISKFIDIVSVSNEIVDEQMGVKIIFVKDNHNVTYELVAPNGNEGPVTGVLKRDKDYLNHIAYECDSFDDEISRLRNEGLVPLGKAKKAKAFEGAKVIFFLSPLGFIIELIEVSSK